MNARALAGTLQLSAREILLVGYFRAMKTSAQHMMVDFAEEIAEALPATPPEPATRPRPPVSSTL